MHEKTTIEGEENLFPVKTEGVNFNLQVPWVDEISVRLGHEKSFTWWGKSLDRVSLTQQKGICAELFDCISAEKNGFKSTWNRQGELNKVLLQF